MAKTALIVADMLNDFLDPQGSLYMGAGREIIPFVAARIEAARLQGGVVIFVCDAHAPDDREFKYFASHAVKGSWGSWVIPELPVLPEDYRVDKTRYSAFAGTNLDKVLQREGVERVEVVGVSTSICVMDTAGDLRNRDYSVVIPVDAMADFDPEFHDFALRRMKRVYGARLVSSSA